MFASWDLAAGGKSQSRPQSHQVQEQQVNYKIFTKCKNFSLSVFDLYACSSFQGVVCCLFHGLQFQ